MNARELLSTMVQAALPRRDEDEPQVTVIPYVSDPDITGPTVLIHAARITPHPLMPQTAREWTCEVWCLVDFTVGSAAAEDELESLLLDVLDAMDGPLMDNDFVFTEAVRGSFEQRAPAWRITCTVPITR